MEKVRKGYKILAADFTSPYSPSKIQYLIKNWVTPLSWLHGPLSVFRTIEDAEYFRRCNPIRFAPLGYDKLFIWEVEYTQENRNEFQAFWCPKPRTVPFAADVKGPIELLKCTDDHPQGTDFARAVKLIRRIYYSDRLHL